MRASVLFAIVCVLGCAIVGSTAQKVNCVEPPANNNKITLRFMRHGWSCAQCCRDIVLKGAVRNPAFPDCLKSLVKKKDPVLTTIGLKLLTEHAKELSTCLPNDEWTLMASTMTRTIETALALFPKSKVNVVPYMKECLAIPVISRCSPPFNPDIAPEDTLANSVDEQQKKLGAVGREVNYYTGDSKYSVVKPGPNKTVLWTEAAMTTDPEAFFKFLCDYAKKNNKRKFLLVTHNGVMVKLLLKFGPKLTLLDNAEMWEGTLNLDGSVVKGSVKQVYKPVNTGGSCKAMTPAAFIKATDRCSF